MTRNRWMSGDAEVTDALRALYSAPADESYWERLEASILTRVARGDEVEGWWGALAQMSRPGLVAAAALILAATLALLRSHQVEARNAYATVIAPSPAVAIEPSSRTVGDGDVAIHFLLPR